MKLLTLGLSALGLLTASLTALGDVRITSFEEGLAPWFGGPATNSGGGANIYGVTTAAATHATTSAEAVMQMTGSTFQVVFGVPASDYSATLAQATGIQADVYIEWANQPTASGGGTYQSMSLNLNSTNTGYANVSTATGQPNLRLGQWTTITWPLTSTQAAQISAGGQGYANIGFLLNSGVWGSAVMGGTVTIRIDNVIVLGAASVEAPPAPTGLAATGGHASVGLSWSPSEGALTYSVKRSLAVDGIYTTVAQNLAGTSHTDTGLAGNTTYYYVVTATNANGESLPSTPASATTDNDEVQLTSFETGLAPWLAGGDLTSTAGGTTHSLSTGSASPGQGSQSAEAVIQVSSGSFGTVFYTPVSNYRYTIAQATGIKVDVYYERQNHPANATGGTYEAILLNHGAQGMTDINLPPSSGTLANGEWRTLVWNLTPEQISRITTKGLSYSNLGLVFSAGTWGSPAPDFGGTVTLRFDNLAVIGFLAVPVPAAVTGLSATGGDTQVALTWNSVAGASDYTVLRSSTSGGAQTVVATGLVTTSHTDTGLAPSTTYYYTVLASSAGGDGPASSEVSATTEASTASALDVWRAGFFADVNAPEAADSADPDGDGLANLLEYALDGNPLVASPALVPVAARDGSGHLTLTFNRVADSTLRYAVVASDTLAAGSWSEVWFSTGGDNTDGPVTVTDSALLSAHPRRFLRLEVSIPSAP